MKICEQSRWGDIEAFKLGSSPIGRPIMCVYCYAVDGLLIDTGHSNMRRCVSDLMAGRRL